MLSNSTRQDIPPMGTGPEVSDYYAVNVATGEVVQLTDNGQATSVVLVAVPPTHSGEDAQRRARELATQAVALADVVEYARRPNLSAVTRDSPSIRAMEAR